MRNQNMSYKLNIDYALCTRLDHTTYNYIHLDVYIIKTCTETYLGKLY